jgi:hypothetical protein
LSEQTIAAKAMTGTKTWNAKHKAKQRKAIYAWRPWEKSTGPKSQEGKATVSQNAFKHGCRSRDAIAEARQIRALLATMAEASH